MRTSHAQPLARPVPPVAPNESAIRTAITADGASGTTAYYVVLATITVATGTTDISATDIKAGSNSVLEYDNLDLSPMAQTATTTINTYGSTQITFRRVGNFVIASMNIPTSSMSGNLDAYTTSSIVPSGYRPSSTKGNMIVTVSNVDYGAAVMIFAAIAGANSTTGMFRLRSDGQIQISNRNQISQSTRLAGSVGYYTDDDFPA